MTFENYMNKIYLRAYKQKVQSVTYKNIDTISQLVATVFRVLTREKFHVFENTQSSLQRLNEKGASLFILRPPLKKLDPAFLKLVT